jgi:GntR family transcriptional regulator
LTTRPLYIQTEDQLAEIIRKTKPGNCLPSEPELAKALGVSRTTLREAMRAFESRGLVLRKQGAGTFVLDPPRKIESGLESLISIERLAKRIDLKVQMTWLNIDLRLPTALERDQFSGRDLKRILEISRVIATEQRPVAYLVDTLPEGVTSTHHFKNGFTGSVLDLMLENESPRLESASTEINAISAPKGIARRLNVQRGDPLLSMSAELYNDSAELVGCSRSYYLPGVFRFNLKRRIEYEPA